MEILYYTLAAVVLYFASDRLLDRLEAAMGRRFKYRSLVFFAIILGLAMILSGIVAALAPAGG